MTDLTEIISALREEIRGLELKYDREPGSVEVLAVSKRHSADKVRDLFDLGVSNFGENYLQEALEKQAALSDLSIEWHFIGPIQSNKTRGIAENFDWVQSVDREKIANRLHEQRPADREPLNICVQVNLSQEETKSGITIDQCAELCAAVSQLPMLKLRGLMAIPAPTAEFEAQRQCFRQLAQLFNELANEHKSIDTLSMGMSADYAAAIAEGATMVRLGTTLFGPRPA